MGIIIKETIKTSIINYVGIIIGFVSVLFIQTEVLTEKDIGLVRLILDKALLILPFFMLGLHSVASRFYFYFETVDLKRNFSLIQTGFNGKECLTMTMAN